MNRNVRKPLSKARPGKTVVVETRRPKRECSDTPRDETLRSESSKVSEVDAVFVEEEDRVVHVYSVVNDMGDFYERLLAREMAVAKAWPAIAFEFHVRAHQGRSPHQAVPPWSCAVYLR